MPAFDLRSNPPYGVEHHAYDYGVDGSLVSGKEVRREDAHGDTPSLNRLEYLRQFAPHAQDCFCEFSGHNCFAFRAPRGPVRAPGTIGFNVLELN